MGKKGQMKERRGKACAASGTRKGRPPKLDKKVEGAKSLPSLLPL